jgi:hypothetical protein
MRSALTAQLASHTADVEAAALDALALPLVAGALGNSSSSSCSGVTADVFGDVDSVLTDWQSDVQLLDVCDYKQPLETIEQPFHEQLELRQGCSEAIGADTLTALENHYMVSVSYTSLPRLLQLLQACCQLIVCNCTRGSYAENYATYCAHAITGVVLY